MNTNRVITPIESTNGLSRESGQHRFPVRVSSAQSKQIFVGSQNAPEVDTVVRQGSARSFLSDSNSVETEETRRNASSSAESVRPIIASATAVNAWGHGSQQK